MYRLAHSLSIVFGFMVACVQSLCGANNSFYQDNVFTSEPRGTAKVYSQIFKNFAGKKQDSNGYRRFSKMGVDKLGDYLWDVSQTYAVEIENPAYKRCLDFKKIPASNGVHEFTFAQINSKAHPIRAPTA